MPAAASSGAFDDAALVLGVLLVFGALVSGLVRRSFLSLTAVFVVVGFLLGDGGLGVLHFEPDSGFVQQLATVALIVILFRDGLEVESEMLQTAWRLPLRKLVLAMPITCVLIAVVCHALIGLGWTASLLVGALLSPTDPVLSSSVVTNPRVPRLVRHSLNLESGMNDGLALPAVLAFSAALLHADDFVWWQFVLQDVTLGLVFGVLVGLVAARFVPRDEHSRSLYALGTAFACYGIAVAIPPQGNGFIAVFTCAITLGIRRGDVIPAFEHQAGDIVEIVKLGIFVVFGSLLTLDGLFADGWAAVGLVAFVLLIARPVAIWIALAGTRTPTDWKAFMAWFGPKGVATMTFSLLVLSEDVPGAGRIFELTALCVFASILVHGLTDTPGAEWLARRAQPPAGAGDPSGDGHRRALSGRRSGRQACRSACCSASGIAQAAWRRRSWRKTKRICFGGRRPSGWLGRKVAHGSSTSSAHSRFCRKKQSSHDTLHDFRDDPADNVHLLLCSSRPGGAAVHQPVTPGRRGAKRPGAGRTTTVAAKRCLFVPFPQTPPFHAVFTVGAGRRPRKHGRNGRWWSGACPPPVSSPGPVTAARLPRGAAGTHPHSPCAPSSPASPGASAPTWRPPCRRRATRSAASPATPRASAWRSTTSWKGTR